MNKNEKAKIELQKGIEIAIQKAINDAPFDKIETGIIKGVTNNGYTVLINKVLYYNIKTIGGSCIINEVVKVVTPQNQSNNMFILKSSNGSSGGNVNSVNGKVGDVVLNANDVGALPNTTVIPNKTSQLTNDSNYISDVNYVHTDNNFTTNEKNKLSNIESNAQVNTVTGVKGNSETEYRIGNINITQENIGLGNVPNVATNDQTPTYTEAITRSNLTSGEKLSIIFGKVMKWFSDLKSVAFSGSYNDLSDTPTIPTVGNGTITFTQNGTSKGTITTNQSGNTTIALTDNNTTYGVATSSTLGLIKSGTDITVDTNGNVSVNDDSHNHIINNVDGLQSILDSKADSNNYESIIPIATTSTNGLMNYSDKTFVNKLNQEIGTFTPKFANTYYPNGVPESKYTVDGSCYYTVRSGYYQRIGNVVYIYATMRGYYRIVNLENYQKISLIVGLPFAMYGGYQTPISIGASSNIFNTYGTTTDCSTNAKVTIDNGGLQFWNNNGINSIDLRYSTSMFFLSFAGTYIING